MSATIPTETAGFFGRRWEVVRKTSRRWLRQWAEWTRMARRLSRYARKRKGRLAMALACGVGYTLFGLLEPWTMKIILDNILLSQPLPSFLSGLEGIAADRILFLNVLVGTIIAVAFVRGILYYYQQLLTSSVGQQVAADMRLELYTHIQRLSFSFHDRRRTGDVLTRLTSDIRLLRDIFVSLPLTVTGELVFMVGMVLVMFLMDPSLTLIALIVIPPLAVLLRVYRVPLKRAVRKQREREGQIANIASEVLGAMKVVQGFRRERHEIERFTVENKRSLKTGMKAARLEAKLRWHADVAVAVVTALVVSVAARRVLAGALTPGDIIVFASYLRTFNRPLRRISSMAERSARGTAAGERVVEILDTVPAVRDLPAAVDVPDLRGDIVFEDVSFAHRRGPEVLSGIDLMIREGERVAIVGPTGSGKTSLVSLIPRFYDATAGRILVGGRDVREITLASLRRKISLVFQEPILFATTIAENIAYGKPDATLDEVVHAAEEAGIAPILAALPEGYDTVLGERGGTLSGGQRQCVAIARAIIRDAPIVILDEPTTGLDNRSAELVTAALDRLMRGRTVILISHHLQTIREVDRIVVLEGGRIVEEGTHASLLSRGGVYETLQRLHEGRAGP